MTVCEKWKQDPSVNPRTGRQIKPTGKVYKDLEIECANESPSTGSAPKGAVYIDPYAPQAGYVKDCVKWRENPGVSPITGKKLKIDGAAYKQWEEDCKNVKPLPNDMQFKSEFVDQCIKWRDNPGVNPITGNKIKIGGPTYKQWEKDCEGIRRLQAGEVPPAPPPPPTPLTSAQLAALHKPPLGSIYIDPRDKNPSVLKSEFVDECIEWHDDPGVNPKTGKKIKIGGPTYKKFEKDCEGIKRLPDGQAGGLVRWATGKVMSGARHEDKQAQQAAAEATASTDTYYTAPLARDSPNTSWFKKRLNKGLRINNFLRAINADQWDMCMTGTNAPAFRANFSDVVEIGKGSFGQVYRATLNGDDLVIKEAYLNPSEKRRLKKGTAQKQKWEAIKKNSYPHENRILDLVNNLLLNRRCPNFVYVYNMAMCDGCKVERLFGSQAPGSCYVTFMESADSDLGHVALDNFDEQLSVLYQLLIAVYAIHRYYAIHHRDIKSTNVFIKMIKPGGYFEYVIEDKTYYVKNTGVVAYLADFGVSEVMSPLYAFRNYYGIRNAEVMKSSHDLYWRPISVAGRTPINWSTASGSRVKGTMNEITDPNIKSSVPINLNNNQKFPPFEFYDDIQDVIRIFVGGKQADQPGNHRPMKTLSPKLKALINDKKAYLDSRASVYTIQGTVKYVLANEMLNHLYIKPRSVDNIVERFVM